MKSAKQTTLLMLILAAISVVGAMAYYPWPEAAVADEEVGKPLFEEYSADKIRGIDIVELDSESRTPSRIQLGRRAEKWVVPSRQNFIVSNSNLVSNVVNSLNDRTVYDVISENKQDHIQFGVVDPDQFSANQNLDSVGKKLTLTDRNKKTIAELIIGSPVKNDASKRYVRIPGKPRIYLVDFDDQILRTQFTFWVTPNPMQLKTSEAVPGFSLTGLRIRKNKPAIDEGKAGITPVYDAQLTAGQQRLEIASLQIPTDSQDNPWKKLRTIPAQEAQLAGSIRGLFPMLTDDVRRKKKSPARAFKKPDASTEASVFKDLTGYGFFSPRFEDGLWKFDGESGSVEVSTREGVLLSLSIGRVGNQNSMSKAKVNHFLMINAAVDAKRLKEPPRPKGLADDDSDENKKFRRILDSWKESVKAAQSLADDLNAIHGDWFYLVSEDSVNRLLPDITIAATSASADPPKSNTSTENADDSTEKAASDAPATTEPQPAETPAQAPETSDTDVDKN